MVKLYKLNNDKITIFHLEVQTAREAGDRGFQMSLKRLYNRLEVALRVLSFSVALEIVWGVTSPEGSSSRLKYSLKLKPHPPRRSLGKK